MKDPITGRCIYELFLPNSQSLKEKRHPVKSIKDTVRNRFNVSVAEVGETELWQRSTIAVAMVAGHDQPIRETFMEIRRVMESRGDVIVADMRMDFF